MNQEQNLGHRHVLFQEEQTIKLGLRHPKSLDKTSANARTYACPLTIFDRLEIDGN